MHASQRRIAIVGAGFAGLALGFYLTYSASKQFQVTLLHQDPLGYGASGVASGLLHPFPAAATKLSFHGHQALHESLTLLQYLQSHATLPLYEGGGIIKLAIKDEDKRHFAKLCLSQDSLVFCSPKMLQKHLHLTNAYPGVMIKPGYTVYCKEYLHALASAFTSGGGKLERCKVTSLDEIKDFDAIILCTGAGIKEFDQVTKLQFVKGQILTMEFPFPIVSKSIIGQGYITKTSHPLIYHVGSSYEHHFKDSAPDLAKAKELILKPWIKIFPQMSAGKILSCDAGVRVMYPKTYLPVISRLSSKVYRFTGLGSRGLLYHAYLAKQLATALEQGSLEKITREFLQ